MREAIADAAFRHHEEVLRRRARGRGRRQRATARTTSRRCAIHRIDPQIEARPGRAAAPRCARPRDAAAVEARLADVRDAARGTANLLPPMREALRARATVGEVCGVLREEFGEYDRVRAAGERP